MWEARTTEAFDRWFSVLGETPEGRQAQIEIDAAVRVLREVGPTLGRPLVDTLGGSTHANLKELRARAGGMVIRIAFAFDPLKRAIFLVGGDKGGVSQQRFYKGLIARAAKLYDDHLKSVAKEIATKRQEPTSAKFPPGKRRRKGGK